MAECNEMMSTKDLLKKYLDTPTYEEILQLPDSYERLWEIEFLFEDLTKRHDLLQHLTVSWEDLRIFRSVDLKEGCFSQRSLLGKDRRRMQLQLFSEWVELWVLH